MKFQQWMRIDLGALLRGRVVFAEPAPTLPPGAKSLRRRRLLGLCRRGGTTRDLIQITDQLHQLVTCQAPLAEGLTRAATDCPSAPVARQLYRLAQALEQGGTLAEGLGKSPALCPRYYADLVGAAESSGRLDETLAELSQNLEQNLKTGHILRSRTVYILVLLTFTVVVGTFLNAKAFSVLNDVWSEFGGSVHGAGGLWGTLVDWAALLQDRMSSVTEICSEVLSHLLGWTGRGSRYWEGLIPAPVQVLLLGGVALLAAVVALSFLLRRPARYVFDRLPIIRGAAFDARWGHALNIISMLLDRGIPLDQALESAAGSDLNPATSRVLRRMSGAIRSGMSFDEVLQKERARTPRSMAAAVAFGVRTGRLPEMLARLSHLCRLRAQRTLRVVSDIAFPLAIIGCGVLVFSINSRFFMLMSNLVDGIMGNM